MAVIYSALDQLHVSLQNKSAGGLSVINLCPCATSVFVERFSHLRQYTGKQNQLTHSLNLLGSLVGICIIRIVRGAIDARARRVPALIYLHAQRAHSPLANIYNFV